MKALTPAEVRRLDLNAEGLGVPVSQLMENAGKALAKVVSAKLPTGGVAIFLCGKGNNGGDGFAAAAELQAKGVEARIVLAEPAARIRSTSAQFHYSRLKPGTTKRWPGKVPAEWNRAAVIVDCLLGVGIEGIPRPPYSALIAWANRRSLRGTPLIACDIPSGLGTTKAIRPTSTVTFHAKKAGMTTANSGRIQVAPIGIPRRAVTSIGLGDFDAGFRIPNRTSHKGENGVVLIVAGSIPLAGAVHYAALGAFRTGADLVLCAVPGKVAPLLRAWSPEPIVYEANEGPHLRPEAVDNLLPLLERCTSLLIGPGLGPRDDTRTAVHRLLEAAAKRSLPTVIDADGLDALDDELLARLRNHLVVTPHAREFFDLTKTKATPANVEKYARRHKVTVLRKGAIDLVSDGARTLDCRGGHPTLTVGGTGDVLAGITAALLAKGAKPFEAACAAAYLLKSAGEIAGTKRSFGAGPLDVAEAIPSVLLRLD